MQLIRYLPAVCVLTVAACAGTSGPMIEVVAQSGDPAPGTDAVYNVNGAFQRAMIGRGGHVLFNASLTGEGVNHGNLWGIWSGIPGSPSLIIRAGDDAPGYEFAVIRTTQLYPAGVSASGAVKFAGTVLGVSQYEDSAIWGTLGGPVERILAEGQALPDPPGSSTAGVSESRVSGTNSAGASAYRLIVELPGGGANEGIYSDRTGAITKIASPGDPAPGLPGIDVVAASNSLINDQGDVLYRTLLTGPGIDASNNVAWWLDTGSGVSMIARNGQAAPGAGGLGFLSLQRFTLNNLRDVAFVGVIDNPDDISDAGLWAGSIGGLTLLVRHDDPAPGLPGDTFTAGSIDNVLIDEAGNVVFTAWTNEGGVPGRDTLWITGPGGLEMIAAEGTPTPGVPGGVFSNSSIEPRLNGTGQVAFSMSYVHPQRGIVRGVWTRASDGTIAHVLSEGDVIELGPGGPLEIFDVAMCGEAAGPGDGRQQSFDDSGAVLLRLSLLGAGDALVLASAGAGGPCSPADLAAPFGTLDLADVVAFVTAFSSNDAAADFAEPFGVFDLADVVAFVVAFGEGCP